MTRMVYLYYISCLRYTILVGNPRNTNRIEVKIFPKQISCHKFFSNALHNAYPLSQKDCASMFIAVLSSADEASETST